MSDEFDSANQFLMGGGGKSAKFETIGDTISGVITSAVPRQQTDFKTNKPLFWDDGNPKMQLVVTLFTDLRDDPEDDGMRNLYVKGQMQKAVAEAVKKSGARGLAEGGTLTVKFFEEAEPVGRNNPAKQYRAKYEQPVVRVSNNDPDDEPF